MLAVVWSFQVRAGSEDEFEQLHGADGDWTALSRRSRSFLGSSFLRELADPRRYSDAVTANGSVWRASSASCAATQFRNVVSFTPNRRATAARESLVDNANCTASRRNSSGYLDGRPIRDSFLRHHARIRCPPNRVNSKHDSADIAAHRCSHDRGRPSASARAVSVRDGSPQLTVGCRVTHRGVREPAASDVCLVSPTYRGWSIGWRFFARIVSPVVGSSLAERPPSPLGGRPVDVAQCVGFCCLDDGFGVGEDAF